LPSTNDTSELFDNLNDTCANLKAILPQLDGSLTTIGFAVGGIVNASQAISPEKLDALNTTLFSLKRGAKMAGADIERLETNLPRRDHVGGLRTGVEALTACGCYSCSGCWEDDPTTFRTAVKTNLTNMDAQLGNLGDLEKMADRLVLLNATLDDTSEVGAVLASVTDVENAINDLRAANVTTLMSQLNSLEESTDAFDPDVFAEILLMIRDVATNMTDFSFIEAQIAKISAITDTYIPVC
jgi:hypothetical protein